MLNGIKKFFQDKAERKAKLKQQHTEKAKQLVIIHKARVDGRVNLKKRIEDELDTKNCPVDEIVTRFQSVIDDEHFGRFYLPEDFFESNPDNKQYTNIAMVELLMQTTAANASRVPTEDALNFAKTIFDNSFNNSHFKNDVFTELDSKWSHREEPKLIKYFLAYGLGPLAARIPQEDKIEFFEVCESKMIIKIMAESGDLEDFAALMYNIFSGIELSDIDAIMSQSNCMGYVQDHSDPEKLREAFDTLGRDMDPMLVHALKKYIGHKPSEVEPPYLSND